MSGPEDDFRAAIADASMQPPREVIADGCIHRFNPSGTRGDDAGWYVLHLDGMAAGAFGNWRDGLSQCWAARHGREQSPAERKALAQRIEAMKRQRDAEQRQRWADAAARNARVWAQCRPLTAGDPAMRYLARRGLGGAAVPSCLRLHPAMPYWDGAAKLGQHPAMVAPLVSPDGRMLALHRTYLTADGRKANVPSVKKLTAASGPLAGACIPLAAPAHGLVGIAEGIETALAASMASGIPTVAAYCAGNLAAWQWPASIQRLVIFADADKAGRMAAETLRVRALAAGLRARALTPTTERSDWADVWASRAEAAA